MALSLRLRLSLSVSLLCLFHAPLVSSLVSPHCPCCQSLLSTLLVFLPPCRLSVVLTSPQQFTILSLYMCSDIYTHTDTLTHTPPHPPTHRHTHTHTETHTHTHTHTNTHTHTSLLIDQ